MKETTFEKLQNLAENQELVVKMQKAESTQEALSIMKEYGIDATEDELIQFLSSFDTTDGELDEDMLDGVSGGGKLWNWIKDRLNSWFKKQSKKNADDIGDILSRI